MSKYKKSSRWLLTEKILSVMREHKITYQGWATALGISQQRLHSNVTGKYRGADTQKMILLCLSDWTGLPQADFYKEEG